VYKNWVHTEEISYTYHDKSGRLSHFNNIVDQTTHQYAAAQDNEISAPGSKIHEVQSLQEAQKKIKELERRIKGLEKRIPQRYPDVKYLNYRSRKRILVSIKKILHVCSGFSCTGWLRSHHTPT
jgi:peptidoglycan hydrolase CwlO-like protein